MAAFIYRDRLEIDGTLTLGAAGQINLAWRTKEEGGENTPPFVGTLKNFVEGHVDGAARSPLWSSNANARAVTDFILLI